MIKIKKGCIKYDLLNLLKFINNKERIEEYDGLY
jgi:hypothetical protein